MASPSFTPATPGNLVSSQALSKNQNLAKYLDYSTKLEGQVTARVTTSGSVTATTYTKHEAYSVYGSTTLNGGISLGATSSVVTANTGMATGQFVIIENEKLTLSQVNGTTITHGATQAAHSNGAAVYLVEQLPTYPGTNSLGGTAATTYAKTTFLSTGQWVFLLTNTDTAFGVLVELSAATIDSFG